MLKRIDGIPYPNFDLLSHEEVLEIFHHTVDRRNALNADVEGLIGHMCMQGWMDADEAVKAYDLLDETRLTWRPDPFEFQDGV